MAVVVSSYDNVKPLKEVGCVVWWGGKGWREGGWREGCIIYIIKYIHNK